MIDWIIKYHKEILNACFVLMIVSFCIITLTAILNFVFIGIPLLIFQGILFIVTFILKIICLTIKGILNFIFYKLFCFKKKSTLKSDNDSS